MSSAYNCELAHRSTYILATLPMTLRERLPLAWDEGMFMIAPDGLPDECKIASSGLRELRRELRKDTDSDMARYFGSAFASLRRQHHHPTIMRFAKLMLEVEADLERQPELEKRGPRT